MKNILEVSLVTSVLFLLLFVCFGCASPQPEHNVNIHAPCEAWIAELEAALWDQLAFNMELFADFNRMIVASGDTAAINDARIGLHQLIGDIERVKQEGNP